MKTGILKIKNGQSRLSFVGNQNENLKKIIVINEDKHILQKAFLNESHQKIINDLLSRSTIYNTKNNILLKFSNNIFS
jgi:hypothetical protein